MKSHLHLHPQSPSKQHLLRSSVERLESIRGKFGSNKSAHNRANFHTIAIFFKFHAGGKLSNNKCIKNHFAMACRLQQKFVKPKPPQVIQIKWLWSWYLLKINLSLIHVHARIKCSTFFSTMLSHYCSGIIAHERTHIVCRISPIELIKSSRLCVVVCVYVCARCFPDNRENCQ